MFVCAQVSLSCMPVILCMPLCAPQSFTWHQSESSGIVISLPTACCWLKPAVCTLFLHRFFFFSLSSTFSPASLSFASAPLLPSSTPQLQSRTIMRFLRCLLPKKGPISSSAESYELHSFSLQFTSISLFSLSLLYIFRLSLSETEPPITYLQGLLEPFSCF